MGDLVQPIAGGVITHADVRSDLYDLVPATESMRETPSQVTIYKNGGGAHLDLMMTDYVAGAI